MSKCGFARVGLVWSSEKEFKSTFQASLKLEDNYFQRKSGGRTCSRYENHVKAMRRKWRHPQSGINAWNSYLCAQIILTILLHVHTQRTCTHNTHLCAKTRHFSCAHTTHTSVQKQETSPVHTQRTPLCTNKTILMHVHKQDISLHTQKHLDNVAHDIYNKGQISIQQCVSLYEQFLQLKYYERYS